MSARKRLRRTAAVKAEEKIKHGADGDHDMDSAGEERGSSEDIDFSSSTSSEEPAPKKARKTPPKKAPKRAKTDKKKSKKNLENKEQ